MNTLQSITGTVSIEVEPEDNLCEEMVEVFMDIRRVNPPDALFGADYETSDAYQLVGKYPGTKVKAFLTPIELARLEDKARDLANGVNES